MIRNILLQIIALTMISGIIIAQENRPVPSCGMDALIKQTLQKDPKAANKYFVYEENMKQLAIAINQNPNNFKGIMTDTLINGKRIIPIVFHVIHTGGSENISKDQVYDAVARMNLDYNRLNEDTNHTFGQFKTRAASFDVEFRLARFDPEGNCTDGIDRVYDPATDYAQYNVMRPNSWPYSKYLNVYAVKFIYPEGMDLPAGALIGGLSPFTPDNTLSGTGGDTLCDGVLVRHDAVGTIGTAANFAGMPGYNCMNRVMTHETGHFLNLYHTFQDITALIAGKDGCGIPIVLFGDTIGWYGSGDEIDDTPPVRTSTQGCPAVGSVNTCAREIGTYGDEPDMVENFMDYANGVCQNAFTSGQLTRVNTTLTSTRRSLWSYENLVATGVLDTGVSLCPPTADFYYNRTMICEGGTVTFSDWSYNGTVDAWEWTFDGGTPATSTLQNPVVTYSAAGRFSVSLRASNSSGNDIVVKDSLILVSAMSDVIAVPYSNDFESGTMDNTWMINNQNGNTWMVADSAAFDGTYSLMISNFSSEANARFSDDEIYTGPYDLTQFSSAPKMKFDLAYASRRKISTNPLTGVTDTVDYFDNLKIFASYNCGVSWMVIYNKSTTLPTAGLTETRFIPTSQSDWRHEVIN